LQPATTDTSASVRHRDDGSGSTTGRAWTLADSAVRDGCFAAVLVCVIAAVTNFTFRAATEQEFSAGVVAELQKVAMLGASLVDVDRLAVFTSAEQTNTPPFEAVAAPLRAVRDAMLDVAALYTVRVERGRAIVQVDCALPGEHDKHGRVDQRTVGEVLDDPPPELFEAWREKSVVWTGTRRAPWGPCMALFHPLPGRDGQVASVVAVVMDLRNHELRMAAIQGSADRALGMAVAAGLLVGLVFTWLRRTSVRAQEARRRALVNLGVAKEAAEAECMQKGRHIVELEQARAHMLAVAKGVSDNSGDQFLARLAEAMASSLGADFTMFVDHVDGEARRVSARVVRCDGAALQPVQYGTRGTPYEELARGTTEHLAIAEGVQQKYPDLLPGLGMQSFLGCALRDSRGTVIGLAVAMSRRPIAEPDAMLSTLRIYAARAAAEVERLRSVADLQNAKVAAEDASQSKTEFLASMSHEIRTPMTAILGFAELMREDVAGKPVPATWLDHLQTIQSNGQMLLAIINDILDLSKIEAGKMSVEMVTVAPDQVVRDVCSLLRPRAEQKGLSLAATWQTPVPATVRSDPVRLRQILVNLVGNAIKFTDCGSVTVRVSLDETDGASPALEIAVCDTGIGMTAEQMGRLFCAFEQADTAHSRRFGGTGLGLRISQRLAHLLGGSITVSSQLERGSTFALRVPTGNITSVPRIRPIRTGQPSETRLPEAQVAMREALAGVRMLVVDDAADNRRLLGSILQRAGAVVNAVATAASAQEALGEPQAAAERFDVILMDMHLPDVDGMTVVRELRAKGCKVPILAVTANVMPGDREQCLQAGCDGYAAKPIDRARLVVAVREAVDASARTAK
jgi:signal transduction histidine kinase/CheY-like chemotaxis protein